VANSASLTVVLLQKGPEPPPKKVKLSAGDNLSGATTLVTGEMGEALAWKKEEYFLNQPVYIRAGKIIHSEYRHYVDKLQNQRAEMAIPSMLNSIPRLIGDTNLSYADFILTAEPGLAHKNYIKMMLQDIPD
jgi:hypothetical protein